MNKNSVMLLLSLFLFLFLLTYGSAFAQKPPLDNNVYDRWKSLSSSSVSDDGNWVTYIINPQQDDGWLYIYNVATGKKDSVARGGRPAFSADNKYMVYKTIPAYSETRQAKKKKLKDDKLHEDNLEIRVLPDDTLLDNEKYKVDIWSWQDIDLQPMQKKQLEQEKERTFMAVYHLNTGKLFQLGDSVITTVNTFQKGNCQIALGSSDIKYRRSSSWEGRAGADYYIINVSTGTKTLALEKCETRANLSPSCKYIIYWDNDSKVWISQPVGTTAKKNITSGIKVPLYDELNDVPDGPSPHGIAGWFDDEKHVLIYDRYDIWSVDPDGIEPPVNLTNNFGRNNNIRLRYVKFDPYAETINRKELIYVSAFNCSSKEAVF